VVRSPTSWDKLFSCERHSDGRAETYVLIAKADPKDPNADLNTLLGITDN
jgi:hypothetical protein